MRYFKSFILIVLLSIGCKAQQNLLEKNIGTTANKQIIEDSVLSKLQSENDLVVAYAIENFAWARSISYRIVAKNNNVWQGYVYHKNLMNNSTASPSVLNKINVNNASCDSLISYLTVNKAWLIKGDADGNFCNDVNKKCNINDAPGARLWMTTKSAAMNAGYYAPEFYEQCCPGNEQRKLFISVTEKIAAIVNADAAGE